MRKNRPKPPLFFPHRTQTYGLEGLGGSRNKSDSAAWRRHTPVTAVLWVCCTCSTHVGGFRSLHFFSWLAWSLTQL